MAEEDSEDRAVGSRGAAARSVDIEEAQRDSGKLIHAVPVHDHFLAHELGEGVGVLGFAGRGFRGRVDVGNAVASGAGGVEKPLHPELAGQLESAEGALDVHLEIILRIDDRGDQIGAASEMEKPITRFQGKVALGNMPDVFFEELKSGICRCGGEVFCAAGAEVVDTKDRMTLCKKGINKVTSDESGGAGDNATHGFRN